MWRGIKCITDYNTRVTHNASGTPSLPDALNNFYARFDDDPNTSPSTRFIPPPGEEPLRVTAAEAAVPTCLKTATIILSRIGPFERRAGPVPPVQGKTRDSTIPIPIPKTSTVTGLNDYRPSVALTPIVMKCFETGHGPHHKGLHRRVTVDPHQYAYRKNRSTEDAISSVVHTALTHLENKDSYVRLLFVDFTSAFNTIIPQTLVQKLTTLGLSLTLCNWVLDFLTDRPQSVRIHDFSSSSISLSTGSPQGCVLSPLLFTLLTHTTAQRYIRAV
ncbi:hypothetical protein L3Q82_006057 [Scortum barcoo]|uniref:Uncharacterized protein n=1 Tax=Scortum barcoo TaxID=214431 RepID=A0ACB8X1L5_9TELE|nr:hypothetical protein L3Q82_006057 [Scortum barcoo]